jgi:hypothetical protein
MEAVMEKKHKATKATKQITARLASTNAHGVFTRGVSTVEIPIRATARTKAVLRLAFDGNGWFLGHDFRSPSSGSSGGPSEHGREYADRSAALLAGGQQLLCWLIASHSEYGSHERCRKMAIVDVEKWLAAHGAATAGGESAGARANGKPKHDGTKATKKAAKTQPGTALVPAALAETPPEAQRLSANERRLLKTFERRIQEGAEALFAVGQALRAIQEQRLYRETHATFEQYLSERWGLSRSDGYRQIQAARLHDDVSPIGDKLGLRLTSESHYRPLAKLDDPADVKAVLQEVARKAPKDAAGQRHVTAEVIATAVREYVTPGDEAARKTESRAKPQRREEDKSGQRERPHCEKCGCDIVAALEAEAARNGESAAASHPAQLPAAPLWMQPTTRDEWRADLDAIAEEVRATFDKYGWTDCRKALATLLRELADEIEEETQPPAGQAKAK